MTVEKRVVNTRTGTRFHEYKSPLYYYVSY